MQSCKFAIRFESTFTLVAICNPFVVIGRTEREESGVSKKVIRELRDLF